ncbi:1-(5-phosphoribosyl)-5-[(5-phosphoribosylamino)methylideneamino]imidazole-4-carboxamide isomerase [Lacticaseibacillus zhaodongensis]|uniref:1-(5-phosphoribosyl)-5-[(5- phosphoribosylamino)methylideneamino]imidazole-4- carboxamide isomerase n=1 Tax=Lacticaseibacillus zhaodongensis TaxID=2668065 RepID=UPI0012D2C02F|nr:1-(5-phosphoribosyl)-5-[(5-phosphoribosylamino)methylideneamino]imidazole-4-carboxamide isomerase [Lacticaseibacillus zhaodongensis]
MQMLPAIDLIGGQSVRLKQGDYAQRDLINADPVAQAQKFAAAGMTDLHLVDLDGAKAGTPKNTAVIAKILAATDLDVEVGGGIRTLAAIEQYLQLGVKRVILGSVVLTNPELARTALQKFGPDAITIGLDCRDGKVATAGWLETSSAQVDDVLAAMRTAGARRFVVTDIAKDGMLAGPNVALLQRLQTAFPDVTIVASGGMHTPADLDQLAAAGLRAAIVGKALAAGTITLADLRERMDA